MKKTFLTVVVMSVLAFAARAVERQSFGPLSPSAKPYERQYIWPEGRMPDAQPGAVAEKSAVVNAKGFDRSKHVRPFIDWYAPDPSNRTALCVMTVSGGGFWHCCDAARLQPAIDRLVAAGITVADVTYRTPRPQGLPIHQWAWEDVQRAVRVVKSEAKRRGWAFVGSNFRGPNWTPLGCGSDAAVQDIVGVQFRNLATVGGSLWGRFGFSDVLTVFLAMDSYVELYKGGIVPLEQFASMKHDNDILVRLIVRKTPGKFTYQAMRIQRTDFPVLTCAVSKLNHEVKVVIGARPAKAMVLRDVKGLLAEGIGEGAAKFAVYAAETVPTCGNLRGSAAYRTHLVRVLTQRSLTELGGML